MKSQILKFFRWCCAQIAHWIKRYATKTPIKSLEKQKNITPYLGYALERIGIKTRADLVDCGALEAYERLLQANAQINENALLMLHGAITDQDIKTIPEKQIAYLLEEAKAMQKIISKT